MKPGNQMSQGFESEAPTLGWACRLNAMTGKLLWHYQLVHHDIWDRDPPAPPNLLTIERNGKKVDVVAQITKQGYTFVFDRVTGAPIYPIREVAFPQEAIGDESPSPTQPIPDLPEPFTRQAFNEEDFNPWVTNRDSLRGILRNSKHGAPYIPLTERPTIFFPGTDGGAQWGGAASDPGGILYIPAKEIPVHMTLTKRKQADLNTTSAQSVYTIYCASCHGEDRKGSHDGSFPGLVDLKRKMPEKDFEKLLLSGRGMMPSFSHLTSTEKKALVDFLYDKKTDAPIESKREHLIPYQHLGYNRWYDSAGYPVSTPPWGTLTALNINTGKIKWQVPLGEYPELTAKGIPPTGTDNYGGPLVTAGDLIFIAATRDEKIRAFDKNTGKILWENPLPAAGYASASTYSVRGKQFVVIACGGGKLKTKSGDQYVAFALE
jgi:quinoprotein glucose dehydrogenase